MAYTWLYSTDLSTNESLSSSRADISKLKENINSLRTTFRMDTSQFRISSSASPSGVATSNDIISIIQDLNVLEKGQTCSSYNSTQWSSDCGSNYSNNGNCGAQQAGQYGNYDNCSDVGDCRNHDYDGNNNSICSSN